MRDNERGKPFQAVCDVTAAADPPLSASSISFFYSSFPLISFIHLLPYFLSFLIYTSVLPHCKRAQFFRVLQITQGVQVIVRHCAYNRTEAALIV